MRRTPIAFAAFALVFSLVAACSKDKPSPDPAAKPEEPKPAASASVAAKTEEKTKEEPAPKEPKEEEKKAEKAKEEPKPAPAPAANVDFDSLKSKDGVLAPGEADKVLPAGSRPVVKLLEPGAAPRSEIRYALTKGATSKLEMNMDMTMAMTIGTRSAPAMTIPRMTMLMDMTAVDEKPNEWKIDAKLTETKMPGATGPMAKAGDELKTLEGMHMSYWVDAQGRVRDSHIDIPKGAPPNVQQLLGGMRQSIDNMVAPLPAEPVGIGARWQVITRVSAAGADLLQSAIYTLKSREGSKATMDITVKQLSAGSSIQGGQMPAGTSAAIKQWKSGGTGNGKFDGKFIAPDLTTLNLQSNMAMTISAGPEEQAMKMDIGTKVEMKRK